LKQPTPKIDPRTARDIFSQVVELLNQKNEGGSNEAKRGALPLEQGTSGALIRIFARFSELITDRLNRVPEKNFLAFLDLLGASLMPPTSARAPLTFSLAEAASGGAIVRAGTRVAAVAMKGEKEPVVFETERELVVTSSRLVAAYTRDPASDRYADHILLLPQSSASGIQETVFQAGRPIEHILYFADDRIFNHPGVTEILNIQFTLSAQGALNVAWDGWDEESGKWVEKRGKPITNDIPIDLKSLTPSPPMVTGGIEKRWLRCRLIDPISPDQRLPVVSAITLDAKFKRGDKAIENAFTNGFPIDVNRAFYPFGESPAPGDALYLRLDGDFAERGCIVTIALTLSMVGQEPPRDKLGNAKVKWEFWNGSRWTTVADVKDNTANLTSSNSVTFPFPEESMSNSVNGVEGYWVRARLETNTSYGPGAEIKVEKTADDKYSYRSIPAAAPRIGSMTGSYVTTLKGKPPEAVVVYNDFTYQKIGEGSFTPFKSLKWNWRGEWDANSGYVMDDVVGKDGLSWIAKKDNKNAIPVEGDNWSRLNLEAPWNSTTSYVTGDVVSSNGLSWIAKRKSTNVTPVRGDDWRLVNRPEFYLGFEPPAGLSTFPNSNISLYVSSIAEKKSDDRAEVEWQYSTGPGETGWTSLAVVDSTADFTQSGLLEFLPPKDFAPRSEFGLPLFWARAVLRAGNYTSEPQISALLPNTVMARHATRIENEVLGSSDGSKNQTFQTALAPVLKGQQLEVRELEVPSTTEQAAIRREAGNDAISIVADQTGRPLEVWVRWTEAPDFYASGPRDRHYVLDPLAGKAKFGDGISGMIPPMASGNIRMLSYRTGGGVGGNKPARAITELRTTVPYVQSVTNYIAASGGAEAETYESLLERMPRTIRHSGRAVTYEDYEDLAMLASPEVARARCVRFYDAKNIGAVSLLVVPRSGDPKPVPSVEMKKRVLEFIEQRNPPLVQLTVSEPEYVEVSVAVDIAPTTLEDANELKLVVPEKISRFLHPLMGGFEGEGWGFGRKPYLSDLYYLIEAIPGVDHINSLVMKMNGEVKSERQLIASGRHEVSCKF
jgi:hypothetical protein